MSDTSDKLWNSNYLKVLLGNFLVQFSFTLIVPLLPLYLSETFGATKDVIGLVLVGYSVIGLVVRPISGYLVDIYPRRIVLLSCCFIFFTFFAGYLVAGSLVMFAICRTLHGAPFGATLIASSTVAIDVLPSSRRSEGIGYYGLSNNLAMAVGPVLAVYLLEACNGNFRVLFYLSLFISLAALIVDSTIKMPRRDYDVGKKAISFDRVFLVKGAKEAVILSLISCSYGIISTYVVIYGKQELGITSGSGMFFTLFAVGLIISRLTGADALRRNLVSRNASMGLLVSLAGYFIFAAFHHNWAFYLSPLIIGLGNGHMYPAFQTMFVNLAEHCQRGTANSTCLTSWDAGVGLGILFGGVISESFGYHAAFWVALAVNLAGIVLYFLKGRPHFETYKLR